jgi:hypothetical protein
LPDGETGPTRPGNSGNTPGSTETSVADVVKSREGLAKSLEKAKFYHGVAPPRHLFVRRGEMPAFLCYGASGCAKVVAETKDSARRHAA